MSKGEVASCWSHRKSSHLDCTGSYTKKSMGIKITTDHLNHYESHHNNHNKGYSNKSTVSRAITFGAPLSKDKMDKIYRDEMESIRWTDRNKWGFDFYAGRPNSPASSSRSHSPSPSPTDKSAKFDWKKSSSGDSLGYSYYGYKSKSSSNSSLNSCYSYKSTQTTSSSFKK